MGDEPHTTADSRAHEPNAPLPEDIRQSLLALAQVLFRAGYDPVATAAWFAYFAGRMRESEATTSRVPTDPFIGMAAQLMASRWVNGENYVDANERPKELPLTGVAPSIGALVAETRLPVQDQEVRDYLLAAGAIQDVFRHPRQNTVARN
jgi:hypothetical protein